MLQGIRQLTCKRGCIYRLVQKGVNVGLLAGSSKQVIQPPKVYVALLIPAERLIPIVVPANSIYLPIAKCISGISCFWLVGRC